MMMAADEQIWEKLRYFRPENTRDNWGAPYEIDASHLLRLDDFRHFLGCPIYVTHGVKTSGHSRQSYHYGIKNSDGTWRVRPCATDIIIPAYEKTPFDLILDAQRFGFTGIGYYPYWRYDGKKVGGLHLDSRPLKWDADETLNYKHNRWMGIPAGDKQVYIPLTFHNMWKHTQETENDGTNRLP